MTSYNLFQNTSILEKSRVANFAHMIKVANIFIKTTFKDYVLKCNLYPYFLTQQKLLIFSEKMQMLAELKRCVT